MSELFEFGFGFALFWPTVCGLALVIGIESRCIGSIASHAQCWVASQSQQRAPAGAQTSAPTCWPLSIGQLGCEFAQWRAKFKQVAGRQWPP